MILSYNKLWKLLVDKAMTNADLRKAADISPYSLTRMKRNEEVSLTTLGKICKALDAKIDDIIDYKFE